MKTLNLQVTFLMQKGVGTRSHPTTPLVASIAERPWQLDKIGYGNSHLFYAPLELWQSAVV